MRDFIKANEYDAHMHAKFGFLGIFHGAIIHKYRFGQGQSVDLLKRIHTKITWQFLDIPSSFSTNFGSLNYFLGIK
jgi:hypothetical protein